MTDDPAGNGTKNGTGDAVFILYRTTMGHGDVATLLARRLDGFGHRFAGQHFGKLGL